jgi:signal transduction histidine kinase/DNA-binding response OmpR family regulator
MKKSVPMLVMHRDRFITSKETILQNWIASSEPKLILELHSIDAQSFVSRYAGGVFDYFMGVISGEVEIGNCPVMQELLGYFKDREISADELFEICSHFRQAMVDFTYEAKINSKEIFNEISYIFDKNFRGILKFYTDTIFQKLIDARAKAEKAEQAKDYFLSNMSHEIRTPLNAILGFVNLLLTEEISKKHRGYLEIILNSGENLLSIINDILDFSKLRSGEFTIEPKIFSLHEELAHTMELFVASASSKNITITSFIDPKIPKELYGDALRIKQIISNLLSNAIKFTPEMGRIRIEARCNGVDLEISVQDSGIGIAEEDIKNIFSAFTQVDANGAKNQEGTGLGLAISHQLVEHMHGQIGVTSKAGEGSRFVITIPVQIYNHTSISFEDVAEFKALKIAMYMPSDNMSYKYESFLQYAQMFGLEVTLIPSLENEFDVLLFVHEDVDDAFRAKVIASKKKFIALMSKHYDVYERELHIKSMCFPLYCSKMRETFLELLNPHAMKVHLQKQQKKFKGHILVAEDNEANQELIKILLTKYGLTFDLAPNGKEALKLYMQNKYDLILMDEQMPIMDGNEAVQKILAYEKLHGYWHTPVSAITANVIKGARERGLSSGFDAFLGKPIILKEIERVFMQFLPEDYVKEIEEIGQENHRNIEGLDMAKLSKELMLEPAELTMLLNVYLNKMQKLLPELHEAIVKKDYKSIALLAHSVKGSSANFRIEHLQKVASEMEKMAKEKKESYDYEKEFAMMQTRIEEIKIV